MSVLILTDANFDEEVKKAAVPMLVDFWAPWCGPCKAVAPILEEIAAEYDGRLIVAKINVDENQATPARFHVRSIPSLVIIKNSEEVRRLVGSLPKSELKDAIDRLL